MGFLLLLESNNCWVEVELINGFLLQVLLNVNNSQASNGLPHVGLYNHSNHPSVIMIFYRDHVGIGVMFQVFKKKNSTDSVHYRTACPNHKVLWTSRALTWRRLNAPSHLTEPVTTCEYFDSHAPRLPWLHTSCLWLPWLPDQNEWNLVRGCKYGEI